MKLTQELKAFAMQQAGRRCECTGNNCRHHLKGSRCKRGLRGDQWKVYWRSEGAGATRDNIEAWCLDCFGNNFEVPSETVALFSPDIFAYARLLEEDRRKAITLRSILRDAADRTASGLRGRLVLDRLEDDVLLEFPTIQEAVEAARGLSATFRELATRLELDVPELRGGMHAGQVTRWRSGLLVGDAVEVTTSIRSVADLGQVVISGAAAEGLLGKVELEPVTRPAGVDLPDIGEIWALRF